MDRLETIRIFVRVAEAGSFTKAADGMQLPRSTVSAAIQQLEARLRTRLINRNTRSMRLTADGVAYLEWCQGWLSDIDQTELRFRQGESHPRGILRIDVPGRIARLVIAPALPRFFERYPEIELEMGVTDRPIDLVHEGVDCAIRVGNLHDAHLIARRIGLLQQGNYASPTYLIKYGMPTTVADLAHHVAVNYASPTSGRISDWTYTQLGQRYAVAVRSLVTVNCAESYIACGLAGLGLIQIPTYDARRHVDCGELIEVLPDARAPEMPISAIYPARRHTSQRVTAFVEWMQGLYAGCMRE